MSTTAPTIDPAALEARADLLERAAGVLEGRWATWATRNGQPELRGGHLHTLARDLRDRRDAAATPRHVGRARRDPAAGQRDGYHSTGHDLAEQRRRYAFNVADDERYIGTVGVDRRRKSLADHAADVLADLRASIEAGHADDLSTTDAEMVADLDLAHDYRMRAGADRRIARVLAAPPDDWTVDEHERALVEREAVRAAVEGQALARGAAAIAPPLAPASPIVDDGRMRAIGYARVSTAEQGAEGVSLDAQAAQITATAEAKGWNLLRIGRDVASAKTMANRPALAEALAALAAGEAQVLVVAHLDRLTRSIIDGASLFERAEREGWEIAILDLGVDTTTAAGRMVRNVMLTLGQWQRETISERTKEGLAEKRAQGVVLGRPRSGLDPANAGTLARLRELRAGGMSLRKVAETLNAEGLAGFQGGRWTDMTVSKAVKRYGLTDEPAADAA